MEYKVRCPECNGEVTYAEAQTAYYTIEAHCINDHWELDYIQVDTDFGSSGWINCNDCGNELNRKELLAYLQYTLETT